MITHIKRKTNQKTEVLQPAGSSIGATDTSNRKSIATGTYAREGAAQTCRNYWTDASQIENKNRLSRAGPPAVAFQLTSTQATPMSPKLCSG